MPDEFTGNSDVDRLIFLNVTNVDLGRLSQVNHHLYKIFREEIIWIWKIQQEFGHTYLQYKRPEYTFAEQYKNLIQKLYPRTSFMKKVLNWIFKLPEEIQQTRNANRAAANGDLDVLIYLKRLPDMCGVDDAGINNHYNVVDWLLTKGKHPCPLQLVRVGNLQMLQYLTTKIMVIDTNVANAAVLYHREDILNWLKSIEIYPDSEGATIAKEEGFNDILDWLISLKIYPDDQPYAGHLIRLMSSEYLSL